MSSSSNALSRYASSHSLDDLESAIDSMDATLSIESLTAFNFVARRRAILTGWIRILKTIEQSYHPAFNPNLLLGCPVSPGLTPCADPSGIPDPVARENYAAQLTEFNYYGAQWDQYSKVHRLDERAMTSLLVSIKFLREIEPNRTPPDYEALERIVQQAGLSGTRQAKIDTWLTVWYTLSARCIRVRNGTVPAIALTLTNRSSRDRFFTLRPLLSVGGRAGLNVFREIPINATSAKTAGVVKPNSSVYLLGSPTAWVNLTGFRRGFPLGWYSVEYCDESGDCSNGVQIERK